MTEVRAYTRDEVVARGFEARCVDADGCRYLWHLGQGIRFDPRTCVTTLVSRPAVLPEGPWFATELGKSELVEVSSG